MTPSHAKERAARRPPGLCASQGASVEATATAATGPWLARCLRDDRRHLWVFAASGALVSASPAASALGDAPQTTARAAMRAHVEGATTPGWRVTSTRGSEASLYAVCPRRRAMFGNRWGLPSWLIPVAERLALGASDKDIAAALALPHSTVRTAVSRVYQRLGVSSRVAVARFAFARGLALRPSELASGRTEASAQSVERG